MLTKLLSRSQGFMPWLASHEGLPTRLGCFFVVARFIELKIAQSPPLAGYR
jgi:hypothetical protein